MDHTRHVFIHLSQVEHTKRRLSRLRLSRERSIWENTRGWLNGKLLKSKTCV